MEAQLAAIPVGDWTKAWENWKYGWDYGHKAASAPWILDDQHISTANSGVSYYTTATVHRALFKVDLTSIPVGVGITEAILKLYHCGAQCEDCKTGCANCPNMNVVLVDGTGLTQGDLGYGEMLSRITSCGALFIPNNTFTTDQNYQITLNETGRAILEANVTGWAYFGMRIDLDISDLQQCGYHYFNFNYDGDATTDIDYDIIKRSALPSARQETIVRLQSSARILSSVRNIDP